jgi:disulfide oxidoreductase YuzD
MVSRVLKWVSLCNGNECDSFEKISDLFSSEILNELEDIVKRKTFNAYLDAIEKQTNNTSKLDFEGIDIKRVSTNKLNERQKNNLGRYIHNDDLDFYRIIVEEEFLFEVFMAVEMNSFYIVMAFFDINNISNTG